ncbi:MAG: phosphoglycerate dehydrogenase [Actinobacteria bacterium]|nr:phosphoglycerate dehydrogenase [Actinomycetota bacterium]
MTSRPRVLVREAIADTGVELLRSKFDVDVDATSPIEEIIALYDGIVIRSATKLTADLIGRADRLKVIGRAGVGIDNVDVDAATRRGIVVANAPESTVVSAAEQTIGLLVALARNIPQAHAALKEGRWERSRWGGVELDGKTLGVVGFGRIGQQVARRGVGLGMRVVGFDPFVGEERYRDLGVEHAATLDDVLSVADFITLHSPLTDETRGLINRETIGRMRDGVRIVNAARGDLIDEAALIDAIREGKVAGAALDVFSKEPYEGPLLELDEVVVTPHLAASTDEAQDRAGVITAEQVAAALSGEIVQNALNIPVIDQADLEVLTPFVPLTSRLGRLAVELAGGVPRRIVVATHGPFSAYDTRLLTVAALGGVFEGRVEGVNWVNASILAAEHGIAVSEERLRESRDYTNTVEVRAESDGATVAVSGTTIGPEPRLFLAGALGHAIDIELGPHMIFLQYGDQPGVIGRVGTMFGEAGINIANMAVSRTREGGVALMAFSVDTPTTGALVERLHGEGFDDMHIVDL